MSYQHYLPTRIHVENDVLEKIPSLIQEYGNNVIIVSLDHEVPNAENLAAMKAVLEEKGKSVIIYEQLDEKPKPMELDSLAYFIRKCKADLILGYGRRESLYTARMASLLATNNVFTTDLNQATLPLPNPPLPLVSLPIGPIMGEELSTVLGYYDPDGHQAFYDTDIRLLPKLLILDYNFCQHLTLNDIARGSIATLAASIDIMISRFANEFVIGNGLYALTLIHHNLLHFLKNEKDEKSIEKLCLASLFVGISYSHIQPSLLYALATAVNNIERNDFYVGMATLAPYVMDYNLVDKANIYVRIARYLHEDIKEISIIEAAIKTIEFVKNMNTDVKMPKKLSELNVPEEHLKNIASHAMEIQFLKNNSRNIDEEKLNMLLSEAY